MFGILISSAHCPGGPFLGWVTGPLPTPQGEAGSLCLAQQPFGAA